MSDGSDRDGAKRAGRVAGSMCEVAECLFSYRNQARNSLKPVDSVTHAFPFRKDTTGQVYLLYPSYRER